MMAERWLDASNELPHLPKLPMFISTLGIPFHIHTLTLIII